MGDTDRDRVTTYAQRLKGRREELVHLGERTRDQREPVAADQTNLGRLSRMDAIQGQQMALEAERRRQREVARIDAALERLDADEFGYCANCGEPIGAARLEVDPTTPLCVACAGGSA